MSLDDENSSPGSSPVTRKRRQERQMPSQHDRHPGHSVKCSVLQPLRSHWSNESSLNVGHRKAGQNIGAHLTMPLTQIFKHSMNYLRFENVTTSKRHCGTRS